MQVIAEVNKVSRVFGTFVAVNELSFSIGQGQAIGFIGANGAGKTTTMRMLATLDIPDRGSISLFGHDAFEHAREARRWLGWMPDAYGAYEAMTVAEYLDFFARAYGYRGAERRARVSEVMEFTELGPLRSKLVTTLSKGMGQRLCLGRTLINDPKLLILDEPAAGLDPKARVEFKHLIRILVQQGKSVFVSSHILSELEDMCDTMLFIDKGRIVHHGAAHALKRGTEGKVFLDIRASGDTAALESALALEDGVRVLEGIRDGLRVEVISATPERLTQLLKHLLERGLPVFDFHEHERRLEDAFIEMLSKGGTPDAH